jgi:hypothetical protein
MNVEAIRKGRYFLTNEFKLVMAHSSSTQGAQIGKIDHTMVCSTSPLGDIKSRLETFGIGFINVGIMSVPNFLNLLLSNYSFFQEFLCVNIVNRRSFADSLIHHWLSKP